MTPEKEIKSEAEYMKSKATELINESVSAAPGRIAEINAELVAIKSFFAEKLDNILVFKAERMKQLRDDLGTGIAAKIDYMASTEGRNEIIIKGIILRIRDSVSVNKSRLRVKELESYGQM